LNLTDSYPILLAARISIVVETEHLFTAEPGQAVILIAEDDARVREFVRNVLDAEGYYILTARDGEEALRVSRQYPGTIHALLSDVRMPTIEWLGWRELLMERPHMRVLLMSGAIQNPGVGIPLLSKPFGPTVLRQRMRELLASAANGVTRFVGAPP
jgi:two-component system cell cycle sensor histidine kinase/response regulator CckA